MLRVTRMAPRNNQASALRSVSKRKLPTSLSLRWGFLTRILFLRFQMPQKQASSLKTVSPQIKVPFKDGVIAASVLCKIGPLTQSWSESQVSAMLTFSLWSFLYHMKIWRYHLYTGRLKMCFFSTYWSSGFHYFIGQFTGLFWKSNQKCRKLWEWWVWLTYLTGSRGGLTIQLLAFLFQLLLGCSCSLPFFDRVSLSCCLCSSLFSGNHFSDWLWWHKVCSTTLKLLASRAALCTSVPL